MLGGFKIAGLKQRGFTLIELLIATAILGILGTGVGPTIYQLMTVNKQNVSNVTALKQVENVIYWVNRDAQMAQSIETGAEGGFPLVISWVEWDSTSHQVTYSINATELQRSHSINGVPQDTVLASDIASDVALTNCQFTGSALTLEVTASISGFRPATVTRSIQIIPKPLS